MTLLLHLLTHYFEVDQDWYLEVVFHLQIAITHDLPRPRASEAQPDNRPNTIRCSLLTAAGAIYLIKWGTERWPRCCEGELPDAGSGGVVEVS
jgi:hypothetical protein